MAAIQGAFRVVFRTSGAVKAFINTSQSVPFVLASPSSKVFFNTTANFPIVYSSGKKVSFFATTSNDAIVTTSGTAVVFVVTPDQNSLKSLILKIGTLVFDTNQTTVDVPDATGEYDAATNPGGFAPEVGPDPVPSRPKRSQVNLWTVYRIWSKEPATQYGSNTQTPISQADEAEVPYIYTLTFPTEVVNGETVVISGIYQLILIAAPLGADYDTKYFGNTNLATLATQLPDWYETSVGVMVDPAVTNCLNRKRYEFLLQVMCGKCDEDYLLFYSDYVGMLAAMEIQDWPTAIDLYNKLKNQCSEIDCSCSC
jgi:hypothetical protein